MANEVDRSEMSEHVGSRLDDFLQEQDLLSEAESVATKRVIAWQIEQGSFPGSTNSGTGFF